MSRRQTNTNRSHNSGSFPSSKVVPAPIIAPIHTSNVDDEKPNQPNYFKQEKLEAGVHAADAYNYREAIKQFSLIKPDTISSLFLAACARLELQHPSQAKEALIDLNKCFDLLSQEEQSKPPFFLELWYKRALAYRYIGKHEDAIENYTEYIDRCRSLGEREEENLCKGLIARGLVYQILYELDTAMENIHEANVLTENKNPYYLCCRAGINALVFEIDQALEDLEKASQVGCYKSAEALLQRAIVLTELNRHNAAIKDLKKALTLTDKPSQQSDICFQCGVSYYALNDKEQAFQWFYHSTSFHPYNAQAYYRLGVIQREKEQYTDALKSLDRAHELSPLQSDILFQRALVYEYLNKPDDAAKDRKRGLQLFSLDFTIITMLGNRIKALREEMLHTNVSSHTHLELAIAYDGLLNRKKNLTTKKIFYKVAIDEYRVAIETDTKHLYPHAHALIALCHLKMNDFVKAHEAHLQFYNILSKYKGTEYHWKAYLLDVKDKMELGKTEPHLDQAGVSKLIHMELNRRKQCADQETFKYDTEDQYKNQLLFYERLRIDLANLLGAIALLNLDRDRIIDNIENTSYRISKITESIIDNDISIHDIESKLDNNNKVNTKLIQKADYDMIKMKLKQIENIGDMIDQLDVAQLVARHICTRYRSQLLCLKPNYDDIADYENDEEQSSGSPWCCFSRSRVFSSKASKFSYDKDSFQRIVTFAIAFIIETLNTGTIRVSSNGKSSRKDALATALVLIISRAHSNLVSSYHDRSTNIPIDSAAFVKMWEDSHRKIDENTLPKTWNLYEFFRAPGIYYYSNDDTGRVSYYGADISMITDLYGYRLGTQEEVQVLKKLNQKNK
ncbi:unnamed protein product [Rotaria socialis]|uniref:Uncharacterized protein n=1 Tax=Rotaria socialis TaxID=392032 RepID=A0A820LRV0_9BILA|nr:unnamed protein product [Rotaria socialis]CAF4361249.1 unnamed protein product [Rotaria socialis]